MEGLDDIFAGKSDKRKRGVDGEIRELHAKIGELTVVNDFLERGLKK